MSLKLARSMSSRWRDSERKASKSKIEPEGRSSAFAPRELAMQIGEADVPSVEKASPTDLLASYLNQRQAQERADTAGPGRRVLEADRVPTQVAGVGTEVIQRAWELRDALTFLRRTAAGQEAARRIIKLDLTIHHHGHNASFKKYIVRGDKVVERERPVFMNGFGEGKDIHISNEMDAVEASAMIVHESTHSQQKQKGGIHHKWRTLEDKEKKRQRGKVELEMEVEAHLNQYKHELDLGVLSDKAKKCLNDTGLRRAPGTRGEDATAAPAVPRSPPDRSDPPARSYRAANGREPRAALLGKAR